VARPHRQRRLAQTGGGAGPQTCRRPLLRPLPQRRCHPGHPRPAAPVVPGPDLLGHQVPEPRPAGSSLSPVPHRALLGSVRGRGDPRGVRPDGGGPVHVPVRGHRPARARARGGHARGVRRTRFRAGGNPTGQARGRPHGRRRASDGTRSPRGPRRPGTGRGRAGSRGPGLPRPRRPGGRALGPVRRQGGGPRPRCPGRAAAGGPLRRRRVRGTPSDPGPDDAGRPGRRGGVPRRASWWPRGGAGAGARSQARAARDRAAQRR